MSASQIKASAAPAPPQMFLNDGRIGIDPRRTAHLVVDLQNGFMAEGAMAEVPKARDLVPAVNQISQALRSAGGLIVYIRFTVDPGEPKVWSSLWGRLVPAFGAAMAETFAAGAEGYTLWPALDVRPEDLVLDKTRFSAFIPGTCALNDALVERNIDTVIVTGTLTNVCCESTVRDAMQLGYQVLFPSDGNATLDDAAHAATLAALSGIFAEVLPCSAVLERLAVAHP